MKTTRPSFAMCLVAWVGICSFACTEAQKPLYVAAAVQPSQSPVLAGPAVTQPSSAATTNERQATIAAAGQQADAMVERTRELLETDESIECATRHQFEMFDHQILGTGHYYQQGHGLRRLTRFECRSQIDSRTETLFEISDGHFFWTLHETAAETTLSKVSLDRVADAWDQFRQVTPAAAMREPAISGLPRLFDALTDNFHFLHIGSGRLGDAPVWIIEGTWKPEKLIAAAPDQKAAIEAGRPIDLKRFPGQLPERIVLQLAQSNLFPCRLAYLRRTGGSHAGQGREEQGSSATGYRTIVSIDWFEARINAPIDPKKFVYQPSIQATDETDQFLKSLSLDPAETK